MAEDFIVPQTAGFDLDVRRIAELSTLRSQVMSVAAERGRVVISDGFGNLVVGLLDFDEDKDDKKKDGGGRAVTVTRSYAVTPSRFDYGEEGWTGLALQPMETSSLVACARYFFKDVTVYDGDIPIRTFHASTTPSAVGFTVDNRIVVAEGNSISLWVSRRNML